MRQDAGTTDSIWPTIHAIATDGPLQADARADACVVGAGVTGLCTAYALVQDGLDVIVLDDGPVAGGETGRTTAHISNVLDDGYVRLARLHGVHGTRLAAQSHAGAIDWFDQVVGGNAIECGWRAVDGYLFSTSGSQGLDKELRAAREAGLDVEVVERAPLPGPPVPALRFAGQARLEPTKFMAGLAAALRRAGVRIHTQTHAARVEEHGHVVVTSSGPLVRCKSVVEATNAPIFGHNGIFAKQAPHRTYAIAAGAPEELDDALYWDTEDPYHYIRLAGDGQQVLVGGRDHHTGEQPDADSTFGQLERWANERLPGMGAVTHRWSGQINEPIDGLAFIGRSGDTLIATGDSGHGWTHAAIAAQLIADLVAGRQNPYADLYDPQRRTVAAAGPWLKQTSHVLRALPRVLMQGEVEDVQDIAPGQAAIVRRGIRMFACHRDEEGVLHERSAVCRHMGCIVAWNAIESSWDCPCHGSRYDRHGTVINGPANHDLGDHGPRQDGIRAPAARAPDALQPAPGARAPTASPGAIPAAPAPTAASDAAPPKR